MKLIWQRAFIATALTAVALLSSGCEFWQYNIANGNSPPANHGQDDVLSRVASGKRPVAMALEEVCGHRFNQMQSALAPYGYRGVFDNIEPGSCGGNGYGNAIFYLGHRVAFPGHPNGILTLNYTTNNRPHPVRAMAVGVSAGGVRMLDWVTHLEAGDDSAASAQAFQLLNEVHYWQEVTGWMPVVGGDFNLTPNQFPMGDWCGQYRDATLCLPDTPTSSAGKIDYLFTSLRWSAAQTTSSPNSDHKRLTGWLP